MTLASNRFTDLLSQRDYLLADGATGTNLFAMGLPNGECPERWNIEAPERIAELHQSFIDAGADLILTNSFGGTRHRLKLHQLQDRVTELNMAAAGIARRVVDAANRPVIVAGSIGPTGELFEPLGPLTMEQGREAFAEQAAALAAGGVDVLWIETMSSKEEVEAATAGGATTNLPVVCNVSFDTNGSTMMGITPTNLAHICDHLSPQPAAFGTNCGIGAAEVIACMLGLAEAAKSDSVLVAKANCGIPEFVDGAIRYNGTPEIMADYARMARDVGARIIGGCCGTTPEHVRAMSQALVDYVPGPKPDLVMVEQRLGKISNGAKGVQPGAPRRGRRKTH
ncbi:MAG: betaine--homocysteine S-methyltransferase [Gammaproteobacteria bacterium]|nr:betaine--homocysteine S-methyltransferase [Gammaproteobacteria bacterium]